MASFIFAGDPGHPSAEFCKQFAAKYLKLELQVLDAGNSSSLLSKMNSKTIVCIAPGFTLGDKQKSMVSAIKKNNVTLLFNDNKADDMKDYVSVAAEAPYVVVHNVLDGRKQRVILVSDAPTTAVADNATVEMDHPEDDSAATSGQKAKKSAKPKITTKPTEPVSVPVSTDATLKYLAEMLTDDSFYQKYRDSQIHYWQHDTTLVLPILDTTTSYPSDYPSWLNGSKVNAFYAVSISMYAVKRPRKMKYITFQQTDACGVSVRMKYDEDSRRGHFNDTADTYICAGWVSDPNNSQSLPSGWIRPYIEPQTPNSQTTYVSTTGWGVSVTGGGNPDGPSAEVTASYDQSNQVSTTIYDFSVRNRSTHAMSAWNFYYTAMDGNGWANHNWYKAFWGYVISGIADLGKSTMHLNSEAVYEGPQDYKPSMDFKVFFKPKYSLLWSHGSVFHKNITYYSLTYTITGQIRLYPDKVTHPQ